MTHPDEMLYAAFMDSERARQLDVLRDMTPEQRWHAARALYWSMRRLKTAFVRQSHPEWSDAQVASEVKRTFMNVRD